MSVRTTCLYLILILSSTLLIPAQSWQGRDYSHIDEYALSVPEAKTHSISALANVLTHTVRDDVEKARAIYTWIVNNIDYDFESLVQQTRHDRAEEVLARRTGVCYGHANLFTALVREAGLQAYTVTGNVKRAHPETEDLGHAWNAVEIEDEWLLLDTAWRRFLTPPESFIKTYFPRDQKWQCLAEPISREEFDSHLAAGSGFYDCHMSLIHPPVLDFGANKQTTITLGAPEGVIVYASMGKKSDDKLPGRTVGWDMNWTQEKTEPLVLTQRKNDTVEIAVLFPEPGLWYIGVQAGWQNQQPKGAISINITVDQGYTGDNIFPEPRGNLTEFDFYLQQPRERHLKVGANVLFVVESAQARSVAVASKGLHQLEKNGTIFSGEVVLSEGPVYLVVDFSGSGNYQYMLKYTAR